MPTRSVESGRHNGAGRVKLFLERFISASRTLFAEVLKAEAGQRTDGEPSCRLDGSKAVSGT